MITNGQVQQLSNLKDLWPDHFMAKFCSNPQRWYREAAWIVKNLGLQPFKQYRILDIGCGFGYFLNVCLEHGHHVVGLDVPDPMIIKANDILGVPFIAHEIKSGTALPAQLQEFDLIATFGVNFKTEDKEYWTKAQYTPFAQEVRSRLRDGGQWVLRPNQTDDQHCQIANLMQHSWWQFVLGPDAIIRITSHEVHIQWPTRKRPAKA